MHTLPQNIEEIKKLPFFFIIGRPRSGTTLLSTLFDAHPNVAIPFESPVILQLYPKYKNLRGWSTHDISQFVADLQRTRKFDRWNIDLIQLTDSFEKFKQYLDFQTAIKILYLHFPSFFPKNQICLIGDKNPIYSLFFKRIFKIFPEAKFIHLIRDYRDNILSVKKLDFEAPLTSIIAYRWKFSNRIVYRMGLNYPQQFYFIRYEDLITDPSTELQKLCSFLQIEYKPEVLDFHLYVEERIKKLPEEDAIQFKKFHSNLLKPVNTSKSGVWRTEMKKRDIIMAETLAGKWAEQFNYQRKYKTPAFFYLIAGIPAILYVRMAYVLYMTASRLPYFLQKRIIHKGPKFARLISIIMGKNR